MPFCACFRFALLRCAAAVLTWLCRCVVREERREREGFPITSLREMNILSAIDHPYIVGVKEIVVGTDLNSIFMVMEISNHDLCVRTNRNGGGALPTAVPLSHATHTYATGAVALTCVHVRLPACLPRCDAVSLCWRSRSSRSRWLR